MMQKAMPYRLLLLSSFLCSMQAWPLKSKRLDPMALLSQSYSNLQSHDQQDTQSRRDKRLMGLFRCHGWGPGCSQFNDFGENGGGGGGGGGSNHISTYGTHSAPSRPYFGRGHAPPFEPFFALTSGGSWGPTGKRSSPVYADALTDDAVWPPPAAYDTAADARDVIQQLLDSDDTRDTARSKKTPVWRL